MPGRLDGLFETQARINRQLRAGASAAKRELIEWLLAVIGRAAEYAPVEFGDLRGGFVIVVNGETWARTVSDSSGAIQLVRDRQDLPPEGAEVVIYAGTSGIPYAVRQHEEMGYNHPRGGGPKFLERSLDELSPGLFRQLEAAIRKGVQG